MKIGLIVGLAIGATAATLAIGNIKIGKMAKKAKRAIVHSFENMMG